MGKNIAIITSGGDAPGMNACIKAIFDICEKNKINVIAFKNGYQGIIDNDYSVLQKQDVANISSFGGSIIFSGRSKDFLIDKNIKKAAANLKKSKAMALIVLGGEGSSKGAIDFLKYNDIPTYVIPSTIDNDMGCTERAIGFDTAVNNAVKAINDIQQTMAATKRIAVYETMGRYHGDIALYSAVASESEIAIIPEKPKTEKEIFKYIERHLKRGVIPSVVVAEKLFDVEKLAKDIADYFKIESRAVVLGYLQRGGAPSVSDSILAIRMGVEAVMAAMAGEKSSIMCLINKKIVPVELKKAVSIPKSMDVELRELFKTLNNK